MIPIQDLDLLSSDIPSDHMRMVADQCGISIAISLMQKVPGLELYIPASGKKAIDRNYIRTNWTGSNSASIAVHLGIDNEKVKKIAKNFSLSRFEEPVCTTEHMLIVSSRCGEEVACELMKNFPNRTLYIPKNGFSISIRKYIERNFSGYNVANLAIRCGVTERYVRKVISEYYSSQAQCSLDFGL
jgi:Mor family transcriptional regulator